MGGASAMQGVLSSFGGHFYSNKRPCHLLILVPGPTLTLQKESGKDKDNMQSFPALEEASWRTDTTCCHLPSESGEEGGCTE